MPLEYDNFPPTPDDVRYHPDFINPMNNAGRDSDNDMVIFMVGAEDAHTFAHDMKRDPAQAIDFDEVRKGLARASISLTGLSHDLYLQGADYFINQNMARSEPNE